MPKDFFSSRAEAGRSFDDFMEKTRVVSAFDHGKAEGFSTGFWYGMAVGVIFATFIACVTVLAQ